MNGNRNRHGSAADMKNDRIALPISAAAKRAGVSRSLIRKWIGMGLLRPRKVSGLNLIMIEELDALIEGGSGEHAPPEPPRDARGRFTSRKPRGGR